MGRFKKATKKRRKLRLAISGPSGSGKTWTALELACRIAEAEEGRVVVLDTEHGSAADYAHQFDFDHAPMKPAYSVPRLQAVFAAFAEDGYPVVVVDSLSHFWEGAGGVLELVDRSATSKFSGWKAGTPAQNMLVNTLLAFPGHLICCMRAKEDYIVDAGGKPTKIGLAPIQRQGIEYEFAISGMLDLNHSLTIDKSRADELLPVGTVIEKPDADLADVMLSWLAQGVDEQGEAEAEAQRQEQRRRAAAAQAEDDTVPAAPPVEQPASPAQPPAGPAPTPPTPPPSTPPAAPAPGRSVPAELVRRPDEKAAERDVRLAFRVLVLGETKGAVAADEHVSSAIVRTAVKKHQEAHDAGTAPWSPPTAASSASSAPAGTPPPAPTPTPTPTPTSPSPEPAAPATEPPAAAPAAGTEAAAEAPAAADGSAAPAEPWVPEAPPRDVAADLAALVERLKATPNVPAAGWDAAIDAKCVEWYGMPLRDDDGAFAINDAQLADLASRLTATVIALEQRAAVPA